MRTLNKNIFQGIAVLFWLLSWQSLVVPVAHAADGSGTNTVSPISVTAGSATAALTFTFTATELMNSGEVALTVPAGWSAPQGITGTAGYTTASSTSGMIGTVLDAADSTSNWSAGTACTNGLTTDGTTKFEGNFSIKCANGDAAGTDKFYKTISSSNWSSYTTVSFWIRTNADIAANRLFFGHDESSTFSSPNDTAVPALTANTWTYVTHTLSGSTSARDAVQSFGFIYKNSATAFDNVDIYIDDLLIGPGLPTFPGSGVISTRLMQLTSPQTVIINYGSGGGASSAAAPASTEISTFTTQTRTSSAGTATTILSSPTVLVTDSDEDALSTSESRIAPLINVKKVPSPLALPNGPGSVTYTYTVTNPGRVTITHVSLYDSHCENVTFISGDTNTNTWLENSEAWTYTCTTDLKQTTINYATARGVANDIEALDVAVVEVFVGEAVVLPLIHLIKIPRPLRLPSGGGSVTYTYTVTNLSIEPLSDVSVVGDACTDVKYVSGDRNKNSLLESTEKWVYTCTTRLSATIISTAIATGSAGRHLAIDPAIAMVIVSDIPVTTLAPYGVADALTTSLTINEDKGLKSPVEGAPPAQCASGSLLKLTSDNDETTTIDTVVYYCGADGKRYVFPYEETYYTWYEDFSEVTEIHDAVMEAIPIGGIVTHRPGTRTIKVPSDSKVYAISKGGALHWVTDETTAQILYGQDWPTLVRDIPETIFTNYVVNPSITLANALPLTTLIKFPKTGSLSKPTPAPTPACTTVTAFTRFLSFGMADVHVRSLQQLLQCLGYLSSDVVPSGYYGAATKDAVRKFQTANGIEPLGHVGPATRSALNRYAGKQ
ncbi:MAG: peptidoglycan-binding protein [Patescibacteria group bacterium]